MGIVAELEKLLSSVAPRIEPGERERSDVGVFVSSFLKQLDAELQERGIEGSAQIHGSVAKDTWLSGERDLDVFIVLKKGGERSGLLKALEAAKRVAGDSWVEAYAEHPYIKALVGGFDIDIVPCFELSRGEKLASATDRTPLHTEYVGQRLSSGLKREIRLLKKFMHGIDCYGAEVRKGGFSGYLCELLVIGFGSFLEVLEALGQEQRPLILDVENQYAGKQAECRKKFPRDPLIVIDPVDRARNVASPVRESVFWESVAASRKFLSSPMQEFFFPLQTEAPDENALRNAVEKDGAEVLLISLFLKKSYVADVLWGQLNRALKAVTKLLQSNDFNVLRSGAWSDEWFSHVLAFKLEQGVLSESKMRQGPPVSMKEMSERFVDGCLGSEKTVSGPWIAGDRWWVESLREHPDAAELVQSQLRSEGGAAIGIPRCIRGTLDKFFVSPPEDVVGIHVNKPEFRFFLTEFLDGKPRWLSA